VVRLYRRTAGVPSSQIQTSSDAPSTRAMSSKSRVSARSKTRVTDEPVMVPLALSITSSSITLLELSITASQRVPPAYTIPLRPAMVTGCPSWLGACEGRLAVLTNVTASG